jgi:hypothetical protein
MRKLAALVACLATGGAVAALLASGVVAGSKPAPLERRSTSGLWYVSATAAGDVVTRFTFFTPRNQRGARISYPSENVGSAHCDGFGRHLPGSRGTRLYHVFRCHLAIVNAELFLERHEWVAMTVTGPFNFYDFGQNIRAFSLHYMKRRWSKDP